MAQRTYTKEEVQAILARAVERQHAQAESLTHEELVAIGRELGVSREAIEAATAETATAAGPSAPAQTQLVEREVAARVARSRRRFARHFVVYAMVLALLATINLMTGGPLWFVWVALGWGIGIAMHAMSALSPDRAAIEARVRRRMERGRLRGRGNGDARVRVGAEARRARVAGEEAEGGSEEGESGEEGVERRSVGR